MRIVFPPDKADSPLTVDANAVLAPTIAVKSLQPVARRRGEVAQFGGSVQLAQLSLTNSLEGPKPFNVPPSMQLLGFLRAKGADHVCMV